MRKIATLERWTAASVFSRHTLPGSTRDLHGRRGAGVAREVGPEEGRGLGPGDEAVERQRHADRQRHLGARAIGRQATHLWKMNCFIPNAALAECH